MKKYFTRNEARDLGKFRKRAKEKFSSKSFDKFVYACVTDMTRDIILSTIGEISEYMKNMGDCQTISHIFTLFPRCPSAISLDSYTHSYRLPLTHYRSLVVPYNLEFHQIYYIQSPLKVH